jgi:hypothetical protein
MECLNNLYSKVFTIQNLETNLLNLFMKLNHYYQDITAKFFYNQYYFYHDCLHQYKRAVIDYF